MSDRHETDDALRRLEPIDRDELLSSWSASQAKQALFQEITSMPVGTPSPARTRIPRKRLVPAVALAVMLLSAVGAYAGGTYVGEDIPGSPWITAEEAAERILELADEVEIPVPEGRDLSGGAQRYHNMQGRVQVDGLPENLAIDAVCMWLDEWRTATRAGDAGRAAASLDVVDGAPSWPYWTINNAVGWSNRIEQLADAARDGDVEAVTRELGLNCASHTTSVEPVEQG
jgi:hypothetical protein